MYSAAPEGECKVFCRFPHGEALHRGIAPRRYTLKHLLVRARSGGRGEEKIEQENSRRWRRGGEEGVESRGIVWRRGGGEEEEGWRRWRCGADG